ncbi:GntR family transcriptional regulator [Aliisedimentitalea scapharcae]|uniref:GntR family transcriptional regulator n=1 Tax=Aliisedimentitalea scapharcae TaxID=1524259 RepID=A0ABZ2XQK8_9RHOB
MNVTPTQIPQDLRPTVDVIQAEILKRICFLDYPPGRQLKEADLAQEFGVSRTPVRDAISRIKHLGLVETRNGVGTVVVALPDDQIRHVYEMRLHLATLIGTLSPRKITAPDRQRVEDLLVEVKALEQEFDPRRYVELNHRLHILVVDLIGNTSLQSFWWQTYCQAASTWHRIAKLTGADAATALVREVQDLVQAMEHGDLSAVGFVQRIHIGYGFDRIQKHLLHSE